MTTGMDLLVMPKEEEIARIIKKNNNVVDSGASRRLSMNVISNSKKRKGSGMQPRGRRSMDLIKQKEMQWKHFLFL
jgi:hypothetical protein